MKTKKWDPIIAERRRGLRRMLTIIAGSLAVVGTLGWFGLL